MQCVFKVHEGTKSKVFQVFKEFLMKVEGTYLYFISWLELLESLQVHELRAETKITWINIKIALQPFWPFNFHFSKDFNHEAILMEILIRPLWEKNYSVFEYWDMIKASIMEIISNSKFLRKNTVYNFSVLISVS